MPPPSSLSRCVRLLFVSLAVAASSAGRASAVEPPAGLVFSAGVGGGAELGVGKGEKAGVAEAELSIGWEHAPTGLRPEMAIGLGLAPDGHFAARPGLRWVSPELPLQLRAALDWSTARGERRWRWLLVGAALEMRWTSAFSLYAGLDLGVPIGTEAGLQVLARGGASFRF